MDGKGGKGIGWKEGMSGMCCSGEAGSITGKRIVSFVAVRQL